MTGYDTDDIAKAETIIERYRNREPVKPAPAWLRGSATGFYAGFRWRGGAIHFGIKLFRDRSRHYANARHAEYGIAVWCRRARKGQRGYPHTLTFKVVVA